MGSFIEINDTLLLSETQGFPAAVLDLERHQINPITLEEVEGQLFSFYDKSDARLLHRDPVRMFLVQKIKGKWLFWGHALIQSQTTEKKRSENGEWENDSWTMRGTFTISKIYDPSYQRLVTQQESPNGWSYF